MRGVYIILTVVLFLGIFPVQAQFYQTTSARVSFFSSAPVEDIEAFSKEGIGVLNAKNGDISFKIKMRSFKFEKALMQEHFNENYVESEQFPEATFKGSSKGAIDLTASGPQNITLDGVFTIHGVSKQRNIPVIITISDEGKTLNLKSEFNVACRDHDIRIPRLLFKNIAEIIEVSVNADFQILSK